MSIIISQMKDHFISVDKTRYDTSIVVEYFDTATVKTSKNIYKTNFPSGLIFIKYYVSNSDEKFEKLTKELNIRYRAFIGSLVYLLYIRVYLSFAVHKLANFSSNISKLYV